MNSKKIQFITQTALMVALLTISAFIRIPFPLVPITLQTFVVILSGLFLGNRKTTVAVCVYIILGLIGFPVFSSGGGIGYILKPTFGYLLGMMPAGYIIGKLSYNKQNKFKRNMFASLTGTITIYLIGVPYFYLISTYVLHLKIELAGLLYSGFLLTLPGDVIKCLVASIAATKLPQSLKT